MDDQRKIEPPALSLNDFSYQYPDGTVALEHLNLDDAHGDSLAVIGPNGAGKSTLLLCLAGLLRGTGEIQIAGQSLTPSTARQARRQVGLVFQDPDDQLFMPTLEEDVAFGPINLGWKKETVENRVQAALERVHLVEKRNRPPHHLSYGEKRRAALATVLAMDPEILLLDEPTSNLDAATRQEFVDYLKSLQITLLLSTHDLDLAASVCQRCALLSAGQLIATDESEQMMKNIELLRIHRLKP